MRFVVFAEQQRRQVSGPAAHAPSVALGVSVSATSSVSNVGSVIAATVTVPVLWFTTIVNALLLPTSLVAAGAVSVNGP